MITYIAYFILAYIIDISTALFHRKLKPNNFEKYESNIMFKKCLKKYGIIKGVPKYMIISLTEIIILFLAVTISFRFFFNASTIEGITFTFIIMTIFHLGGTITNLLSLFRKESTTKKPKGLNSLKSKPNYLKSNKIK